MTTYAIDLRKLNKIFSGYALTLRAGLRKLWHVLTFSLADDAVSSAKGLCVSIEKGKLSIVYGVRSFSRIKIQGVREYSLEHGQYPKPEDLANALPRAIHDLGAAKADISLCIPREWTILKAVELPAVVKENLAGVVSYELDRITPLKPADAYYDFQCLKEEEEKLFILVEAAKQDFIDSYLRALAEKGLHVNRVTNHLSALGAYFTYVGGQNQAIFVEIDGDEYRGGLMIAGVTERAFADEFEEGDNVSRMQAIADKIRAVVTSYKDKDLSPWVFVNASNKELLILDALLPEQFKVLGFSAIELPPFRDHRDVSYEARGALLESLWPKAGALNVLRKGVHEKRKTPMAATVFLAIGLLSMGALYVTTPVQLEERRIQEFDRQIDLRKDEVKRVEALKKETETLEKEIATVEDFKFKRPIVLDILREITLTLPKAAWLTRIRITDTTVDIEGYANSATELLPKLEASKYLKKVEFASPTFRDARLGADRFVIKMEIEDPRIEGTEDAQQE